MEPLARQFQCPACCGPLGGTTPLVCQTCRRTYPVSDGIIDFRVHNHDYYFNPVPRQEMRALTADMPHAGWTKTVRRFVRRVRRPADWINNLTDDGRYAWKLLLDLPHDGVLLDIGCGLGNLTSNLAPHVGKAYAMDLTRERAAFSRQRFALDPSRSHVVVLAAGDADHLPLPDASIDCVVLSGVLEWVGEGGVTGLDEGTKIARAWRMVRAAWGSRSPRAVQLRFLRDIRRVLKPGRGQLFVAIENRTGARYFIGEPDNHSGLRYSSLLPRLIANLYSILVARRPYRTYTYSVPGYRRLLREAGFARTTFFGLLPGYNHLREIRPLVPPQDRWQPAAASSLSGRIDRHRYLVPAYGIVAAGQQALRPLMADVVAGVEATLQPALGAGRVEIQDYTVTGKGKGLLTGAYASTPLVIKLPFSPEAVRAETANARFLEFAKAGFGRGLPFVPASHGSGVARNVPYFIEDRCAGVPMRRLLRRLTRPAAVAVVEAVLEALNPAPVRSTPATPGELYETRVAPRVQTVATMLDDEGLGAALAEFFRHRFEALELPRGIEHGDLGCSNILLSGDRVTGLVDWEAATEAGIPILDVLCYLEGMQRHVSGRSLCDTIPLLAAGTWPEAAEWAFLERQYDRLGVDRKHHEALVYLYWLHQASSPYGLAFDPARIERDVAAIARRCVARA